MDDIGNQLYVEGADDDFIWEISQRKAGYNSLDCSLWVAYKFFSALTFSYLMM